MSASEDRSFADMIARLCHKKYSSLPKTGKPNVASEWTLLSAVVMVGGGGAGEVVALGTGSKCVGAGDMSAAGVVVNDAHAEVMARRAFVRYLYAEAERAMSGGESKALGGRGEDGRWAVREGVTFHFYTSRPPCGDASIFPKGNGEASGECVYNGECLHSGEAGDCDGDGHCKTLPNGASVATHGSDDTLKTTGTKRKSETDEGDLVRNRNVDTNNVAVPSKRARSWEGDECYREAKDIHRTGAKCVASDVQDPRSPGVGYHVVGVLRTKPGRGDPTLSLSCSDKLAKWNAVGCQGALLSLLVQPVRFTSVVVGGGCPFSAGAMTRAIATRTRSLGVPTPAILRSEVPFPDGRPPDGSRLACASSVAWCRVDHRPHEVCVRGRKQGVTKKTAGTAAGRLHICKRELARRFVSLYPLDTDLGRQPYARLKAMATEYQRAWRATRERCFPAWPSKPDALLQFTLDG